MTHTIKLDKYVVCSDPCYSIPTWCQATFDNVKKGTYVCEVVRDDTGDWGIRNTAMYVVHKNYVKNRDLKWIAHETEMGVDSGQFGIFDMNSYRNDAYSKHYITTPLASFGGDDDDFYWKMCHLTAESKERWGTYDKGVVTSSGYGDGSYTLYTLQDGGMVVGFAIRFN